MSQEDTIANYLIIVSGTIASLIAFAYTIRKVKCFCCELHRTNQAVTELANTPNNTATQNNTVAQPVSDNIQIVREANNIV